MAPSLIMSRYFSRLFSLSRGRDALLGSPFHGTAELKALEHAFTARYSARRLCIAEVPKREPQFSASSETNLSVNDFKELATSEELRKKIHLILLEYVNCRETVGRVPSKLTPKAMSQLLLVTSQIGRTRYFNYLFKTEMAQLAQQRTKEARRLAREKQLAERKRRAEADGSINHIQYGIHNTIFLFIRDPSMARFYNYRQMYAAMFGQTLVYDLDYESEMSQRELVNAAEQLQEAYGANRVHPDPFNLVFCNLKKGSQYEHRLLQSLPHLHHSNCLVTTTESSYLDLYPKEKLVYLSPDAKQTLRYDPDTIYIIGALVDKGIQKPLSLAKAKREGIRIAKLPLEDYLRWGQSASKTLPLNILIKIMLEMKATGDWNRALSFIPKRKLKTPKELEAEAQLAEKKEERRQRIVTKFSSKTFK